MTMYLWEDWLSKLNNYFAFRQRKILLLILITAKQYINKLLTFISHHKIDKDNDVYYDTFSQLKENLNNISVNKRQISIDNYLTN